MNLIWLKTPFEKEKNLKYSVELRKLGKDHLIRSALQSIETIEYRFEMEITENAVVEKGFAWDGSFKEQIQ